MLQSWNYFPSVVYRCELPDWVNTINNGMEGLYNNAIQSSDTQAPYPINTASVFSCSNTAQQLEFFTSYLNKISVEILSSQGYDTQLYNTEVTELWGQELNYGAQQPYHVHSNTILSGVYILSQPVEYSSALVFEDPRAGKSMTQMLMVNHSEVLPGEQYVTFNNLMSGSLVIFNSYLPHTITPNYSNTSFRFLHFCVSSTLKRY